MYKMIKSINTTRGTIVLRESNLADVEQFRDLRLNALQDSPTAFSADLQTNINHPASYWEDRLREDETATIFFAEYENHLIGMTGVRLGQSPKTQHGAGIWGVYIRPEWRGLHIAEALIEMCTDWAKLRDVVILKLAVVSTNGPAVRCYKRCGFSVYGTEPRALLYEGQYYDEFLMSRDLDSP